jgi:uncharacterized membrane protein YhiD involved in acid resistance
MKLVRILAIAALLLAAAAPMARAEKGDKGDVLADTPDTTTQFEQLTHALVRLPIAAAFASILALRPRRRGTPPRQMPIVQTQIILAIVGAVVMLVVGSSLARAFGIVGAAGLVRYRARIADPKDAGVMLSTLAVGLAAGVGVWMLAAFSTVFVLVVLWVVESFEPSAHQLFSLTIKAKNAEALKPKIADLLARQRFDYEMRTMSNDAICYEVKIPLGKKTDRLSEAIVQLDRANVSGVEWQVKKEK